jgi:acyl-CoA thioester hydrolase
VAVQGVPVPADNLPRGTRRVLVIEPGLRFSGFSVAVASTSDGALDRHKAFFAVAENRNETMNSLAHAPIAEEFDSPPGGGCITYRGMVYPWHCDHMGHMNVMWYTGKFDEASWGFLARFGVTGSYLREQSRRMAAVEQTITYRQELFAGDCVTIASSMLEVREKSIRFSHRMYKDGACEPATICLVAGVHIDAQTSRACPLPANIAERARRMLDA